jgi:hypothetical protein
MLPCNGKDGCVRVIRIENGDLNALVAHLLSKFGNYVRGGDLILIFAASQLGREGLVGYVESFIESQNKIMLGKRKDCCVLPGPFIFGGGRGL